MNPLESRVATVPSIIVVEDDSFIRLIYQSQLRRVIHKGDPIPFHIFEHAEEYFKQLPAINDPHKNAYFFDNMMPTPENPAEMQGYALSLLLATYKRGVPFENMCVVSGDIPKGLGAGVSVLEKPFTLQDLRALLDKKVALMGL